MTYTIVRAGYEPDYEDTNKRIALKMARELAGDYSCTVSVYAGDELIAQWKVNSQEQVYRAQV